MTTEQQITAIKEDLDKMRNLTTKIYHALIGNDLGKDGGIVGRLSLTEQEISNLEERIQKVEKISNTTGLYMNIIIALAGVVMGGAITWVFNHI